jgi:hypothetical protein
VRDESTLGGYVAVHTRPPGFTGADGAAYTVDIVVDDTGDPAAPVGGYLLFIRWTGQPPTIHGHLESDFLVRNATESAVRARLDALPLLQVKSTLDDLIRAAPQ